MKDTPTAQVDELYSPQRMIAFGLRARGVHREGGADVARAMALPVFSGMFFELVSLFVVPVFYCGYMEFKLRLGLRDRRWAASEPAKFEATIVPAM